MIVHRHIVWLHYNISAKILVDAFDFDLIWYQAARQCVRVHERDTALGATLSWSYSMGVSLCRLKL